MPEPDEPTQPTNEEILAKISEELGVIPEVGVNIMPCMFFGCVAACFCLMYEVKRTIKK